MVHHMHDFLENQQSNMLFSLKLGIFESNSTLIKIRGFGFYFSFDFTCEIFYHVLLYIYIHFFCSSAIRFHDKWNGTTIWKKSSRCQNTSLYPPSDFYHSCLPVLIIKFRSQIFIRLFSTRFFFAFGFIFKTKINLALKSKRNGTCLRLSYIENQPKWILILGVSVKLEKERTENMSDENPYISSHDFLFSS